MRKDKHSVEQSVEKIEKLLQEQKEEKEKEKKLEGIFTLIAIIIGAALWIFLFGWRC